MVFCVLHIQSGSTLRRPIISAPARVDGRCGERGVSTQRVARVGYIGAECCVRPRLGLIIELAPTDEREGDCDRPVGISDVCCVSIAEFGSRSGTCAAELVWRARMNGRPIARHKQGGRFKVGERVGPPNAPRFGLSNILRRAFTRINQLKSK